MRTLPLIVTLLVAGSGVGAAAQGVGSGRGGGETRCNAPRPSARESDEKVFDGKEVTCRAVITSRPQPLYPRGARAGGVQGVVRLRVVLLASGQIGEVAVVKGLPEGVSEAAVEAAKKIKFTPAIKDDRWVSQRVFIEYSFTLY